MWSSSESTARIDRQQKHEPNRDGRRDVINNLPCVLSPMRGDNFGFVAIVRAILTRGLKGTKSLAGLCHDSARRLLSYPPRPHFHHFRVPRSEHDVLTPLNLPC
jgi:hypothetical protein